MSHFMHYFAHYVGHIEVSVCGMTICGNIQQLIIHKALY